MTNSNNSMAIATTQFINATTEDGYVKTICTDCGEEIIEYSQADIEEDYTSYTYAELQAQDNHVCQEINDSGVARYRRSIIAFAETLHENVYSYRYIEGMYLGVRRTDLAGIFVKKDSVLCDCVCEKRLSELKEVLNYESPKKQEAWNKKAWAEWHMATITSANTTPWELLTGYIKNGEISKARNIPCPPDRIPGTWGEWFEEVNGAIDDSIIKEMEFTMRATFKAIGKSWPEGMYYDIDGDWVIKTQWDGTPEGSWLPERYKIKFSAVERRRASAMGISLP